MWSKNHFEQFAACWLNLSEPEAPWQKRELSHLSDLYRKGNWFTNVSIFFPLCGVASKCWRVSAFLWLRSLHAFLRWRIDFQIGRKLASFCFTLGELITQKELIQNITMGEEDRNITEWGARRQLWTPVCRSVQLCKELFETMRPLKFSWTHHENLLVHFDQCVHALYPGVGNQTLFIWKIHWRGMKYHLWINNWSLQSFDFSRCKFQRYSTVDLSGCNPWRHPRNVHDARKVAKLR